MALAIDASTPALASANSGNVATTAAFTPPAGGGVVLGVVGWHDTTNGNTTSTSTASDSQGTVYTARVTRAKPDSGAQNGHVQISTGVPAASVSTTAASTASNNGGSLAAGCYCLVLTGCDTSNPIDAVAEGSSASAVISQLMTTATDGALLVLANVDWNVAATPTPIAGDTQLVGTGIGAGPDVRAWLIRQTALQSPAGSTTLGSSAPSTGNTNNWVGVAFKPAASGTAVALADVGSAAEALIVTVAVPLADGGSSTATFTVAAAAPLADAGTSTDALTAAATVALGDGGTASDSLIAGIAITLTDGGTATDALTVTAAVPLADTGTAAQAVTVAAVAQLADAAAAADTLATTAAITLTDTAASTDTIGVAATVSLTDVGAAGDGVTGGAGGSTSKTLTDGGAATECLCVCRTQLRPTTGTVTRPTTGTVTRPSTGTVDRCGCGCD